MSFIGAFSSLGVSIREAFRPKTTTPLPWKGERPRSDRYRASFALTHDEHGDENCIGCKMCENICPSGVITVTAAPKRESPHTGKKRGWHEDFTLDLNACIICELCVQVCPTDSIIMVRSQEEPGYDRNQLLLTKDKLYANEKKALSWSSGTVLVDMQSPAAPDKADKADKASKVERPAKVEPPPEPTVEAAPAAAPAAAPEPAVTPDDVPDSASPPSAAPLPPALADEPDRDEPDLTEAPTAPIEPVALKRALAAAREQASGPVAPTDVPEPSLFPPTQDDR